jgi:hypothetical protein
VNVQGRARRGLENRSRHELAVRGEQETVRPELLDHPERFGASEAGRGDEWQPGVARGFGHGCAPLAEAATGGTVGSADDEELVRQGRQPTEEWDAERAAPQERDPAEH